MEAVALIRRNEDGVIRRYAIEWTPDTDDNDLADYMWSEGNYACDCNRALFFADAGGEDEPEHLCGDALFSVRIEDVEGRLLYEDDDWEAS